MDNSSQLCRNAFRCFEPTVTVREARESKWLGKIWIYKCKPLGLRHASSYPLHNSKELYVHLPNQPFRHTYRHGCIAGYYHLMPTASSMQTLII
ncbi:MAG: hypothetical protein IKH63_16210 [Prevotella sp.]|nr:hypothetical protein [Prevotella sp.]